jgi:hypothetical protein
MHPRLDIALFSRFYVGPLRDKEQAREFLKLLLNAHSAFRTGSGPAI